MFLLNIALILLDVHYFDAESVKKSMVTGKMQKNTYYFRKQMAAILNFRHFLYNLIFLLI